MYPYFDIEELILWCGQSKCLILSFALVSVSANGDSANIWVVWLKILEQIPIYLIQQQLQEYRVYKNTTLPKWNNSSSLSFSYFQEMSY